MNIDNLIAERQRLQARLEFLGLRSTGSGRIEKRIREIDRQIGWHSRPPDPSNRLIETR